MKISYVRGPHAYGEGVPRHLSSRFHDRLGLRAFAVNPWEFGSFSKLARRADFLKFAEMFETKQR
jgi:hypothetical protein